MCIDNKLNDLLDYDNGALAASLTRATHHYEFCGLADRIRGLFMDHGFVDATPVPKVIDTHIIFLDQAMTKLIFWATLHVEIQTQIRCSVASAVRTTFAEPMAKTSQTQQKNRKWKKRGRPSPASKGTPTKPLLDKPASVAKPVAPEAPAKGGAGGALSTVRLLRSKQNTLSAAANSPASPSAGLVEGESKQHVVAVPATSDSLGVEGESKGESKHLAVAKSPAADCRPADKSPAADGGLVEESPAADCRPADKSPGADGGRTDESPGAVGGPADESSGADGGLMKDSPAADGRPADKSPAANGGPADKDKPTDLFAVNESTADKAYPSCFFGG